MTDNEILFGFIETPSFTRQLFKLADDNLLYDIQMALIENPYLGDVISGTHGARKARVPNPNKKNTGKRGGLRMIYAYFEKAEKIYLLLLYPKTGQGRQDELTPAQKNELGQVILAAKKIYKEVD